MCRIAGIVRKKSSGLSNDIMAMRDVMHRGGPDSAGIFIDEGAGLALGHRRLSLIDLSDAGAQPMHSEDGALTIIFNGEIYNYESLKDELQVLGYKFKTHSDTEVIIKAYEQWGTDCFSRFKGMFAIAIYDKRKAELILARDQAGIKPLYYYQDKEQLIFASEIRAFKALNRNWETNNSWKIYFLTYGYLPEPITTLKRVQPLEKGSLLRFNINTYIAIKETFYKDVFTDEIATIDEARHIIKETLTKAVQRHLIADAPIGLFLSGGIDSSLLTLIAKDFKQDDLHTLSIVFNDKNYSEKYYQDIVVNKSGSKHQSFLLDKDIFLDALPDIFEAMDQPSADGINTYFISKFAKASGLKAVLSGLGADELLGGYASFRKSSFVNRSRLLPGKIYRLAEAAPKYKYRKLSFLQRKDAIGEYLFNRGYFSRHSTSQLLDVDITEIDKALEKVIIPSSIDDLNAGNRVSYLESNLYMQSQLLKDTDVMSMWHSIEVRVPFLDIDFIRAVHKINPILKFGNKQGKFLLIDAFKDILPREIWDRSKQGFVFPFRNWIAADDNLITSKNPVATANYKNGSLDWSRYWTYIISDTFKG